MSAALSPQVQDALAALNDKQRSFILAYKCGETKGNSTASYESAGYVARGDVAAAAASRLLGHVKVQHAAALLDGEIESALVEDEVDYRKKWYDDMDRDLEAARADSAHGPVMTGQKLLASSERYDLEVNRTTHDVAPELREAIRDRIAGARARTIEVNQGEE